MSARLCRCGHKDHVYFCLVSGCKCDHAEIARCECTDPDCGGQRHSSGARCWFEATQKVDVEVPTDPNDPILSYVDVTKLLCPPCARRAERVKAERLMVRRAFTTPDYERQHDEPTPYRGPGSEL